MSRRAHPSQRLDRTLPQPQGAHAPAAAGNQNPPCLRAGRPPGGARPGPPGGRRVGPYCCLGARHRGKAWLARRNNSCATWTEARVQTRIAQNPHDRPCAHPDGMKQTDAASARPLPVRSCNVEFENRVRLALPRNQRTVTGHKSGLPGSAWRFNVRRAHLARRPLMATERVEGRCAHRVGLFHSKG